TPFSCSVDLFILTATAFAPTIHKAVTPALSEVWKVLLLYCNVTFVLLLTIICLAGMTFGCSADLFILTATAFAPTMHKAVTPAL
ncbi:hypothetical protein AB205_0091560, partial [Aquarana catesbeiana]